MRDLLSSTDIPAPVLQVLSTAVAGRLLVDVDTIADHLQATGWARETAGGLWALPASPEWSIGSHDHDPHVSVFASGSDDLVTQTADRLSALLDTGQAGAVRPGEPDPHWTSWHTDAVDVSLNATTGRTLGPHWIDAMLHLALERTDTPSEGRAHDPARDRRIARTGSPVARWYLAGHDELTDDVVDLLAADDDPAVAAALAAGEDNRRVTRERQQAT